MWSVVVSVSGDTSISLGMCECGLPLTVLECSGSTGSNESTQALWCPSCHAIYRVSVKKFSKRSGGDR